MSDRASFGYWVRRRRKALDLTQEALARRVGCAVITIQKIEADERRPSRQVAELLAQQLLIPTDERAAFLQSARAELSADRLVAPTQGAASAAAAPAAITTTAPEQLTPSLAALPSGTVTFRSTDIEGSTSLWERYPALMREAFRRQEAILREAIAAHSGHAYKMIGDAFQAAFATAHSALAAALAAQRGLMAE